MPTRESARRFHFLREIATGGFGSVFLTKVTHADGFSRLVAVKLLKSQWSDNEEVARRMRDEARLLGLLRHRNIVNVLDLTSIDGRAALIMEYLEAVDLKTVAQALLESGRSMPVRAALEIAAAAANALDAAYNRPPMPGDKPLRVIHRDIKPSNLMVDDTGLLKVLDFGVARSELENRESHTQELQFGSVEYMAPERLFFEPETPASDVYGLAATLYEILALEKLGKARGRPERHADFVAERLGFLRGRVAMPAAAADELEALLGSCLAFEHDQRPTSADLYQRARSLARTLTDDDLPAWAEVVVPPLVVAGARPQGERHPLVDQILLEDSAPFLEDPGDVALDRTVVGGARPEALSAEELRRGALAELDDSGAFVPAPATGAPAARHGGGGRAAADEWEDGPTHVGGLDGLGAGELATAPVSVGPVVVPPTTTAPIPVTPGLPLADPSEPAVAPSLPLAAEPALAPAGRPPRTTPVPEPAAPPPRPGRNLPDDERTEHAAPRRAESWRPPRTPTLIPELPNSGGESPTEVLVAGVEPGQLRGAAALDLTAPADPKAAAAPRAAGSGKKPSAPPASAEPKPTAPDATAAVSAASFDEGGSTERVPVQPAPVVEAEDDAPAPVAVAPSAPPPSAARRLLPVFAGLGCLLVVGVAAIAAGSLYVLSQPGGPGLDAIGPAGLGAGDGPAGEAPAAEAPAAEAPAAEAPAAEVADAPAAPAGPALVFRSAAAGTARLKVQCDATAAQGTEEAVVALPSAGKCTVTAYMQDRNRRNAVVDKPSAGVFICFAGDADLCAPE